MRILITNDDGITAPGLGVAEEIAAAFAGPEGEIWVVAPDFERSGVSHAISYTVPMRITEAGPRRFSVDGYPADCAVAGLQSVLRDTPPDLVISGVNRGHNVAEDVVYSGTVGAAMEAALNGARAVALSQFYARGPEAPEDMFEPARAQGPEALAAVMALPWRPFVFYNVNFPARRAGDLSGLTVCRHGMRAAGTFELEPYTAPNGRVFQFYRHNTANASAEADTDARLLLDGWTTITPLRPALTAEDLLEEARAALAARQPAARACD